MAAAPARVCVRRGVEVRKEGVCEPPSLLPATAGHQPTSNAKPTNPGERWGGGVALLRCKQAPNVAGRRAGANRPPLVATRSNVGERPLYHQGDGHLRHGRHAKRWVEVARATSKRGGGGGGWARGRRTVSKIQKRYQRQCGTAGCVRGEGNPQTTTRRARYAAAVLNRSGRGTTTTTVDLR